MSGLTPRAIEKTTESSSQRAFFAWAALNKAACPPLADMYAIPNGGSRGDTKESAQIVGGNLKAEGVKPGVSDIFLPEPVGNLHGLYIEMKRRDGGEESKEQKDFGARMIAKGYGYAVCHGWEQAAVTAMNYLQHAGAFYDVEI